MWGWRFLLLSLVYAFVPSNSTEEKIGVFLAGGHGVLMLWYPPCLDAMEMPLQALGTCIAAGES